MRNGPSSLKAGAVIQMSDPHVMHSTTAGIDHDHNGMRAFVFAAGEEAASVSRG